jgi:hypothetical protein
MKKNKNNSIKNNREATAFRLFFSAVLAELREEVDLRFKRRQHSRVEITAPNLLVKKSVTPQPA